VTAQGLFYVLRASCRVTSQCCETFQLFVTLFLFLHLPILTRKNPECSICVIFGLWIIFICVLWIVPETDTRVPGYPFQFLFGYLGFKIAENPRSSASCEFSDYFIACLFIQWLFLVAVQCVCVVVVCRGYWAPRSAWLSLSALLCQATSSKIVSPTFSRVRTCIDLKCRVHARTHTHTHTHTWNRFTVLWILSGTTRVSRYQKKHSPTHTHRGHQLSLICFIHLLRSMTSSLFNPRTWQSFLHNLSPSFLWSTSWHGGLHFILRTFLVE